MRAVGVALLAAGLAAGLAGGYVLGAMRPDPVPPVRERVVVERVAPPISEPALRRVIRDELETRPAAPPATPAPVEDTSAAFDAGKHRVDQALARRQWTPQDAVALDGALAVVNPEQRKALLAALVPALNRGEIKLTYRGPLF